MTREEFIDKIGTLSDCIFDNSTNEPENPIEFTDEVKSIISETAEYARGQGAYKHMYAEPKRKDAFQRAYLTLPPSDIVGEMAAKIVMAPLPILVQAAFELLLPILDDKLNGRTELSPPPEQSKETGNG